MKIKGQYQFRITIFYWEFIITLINWRIASSDMARIRKEHWENLQK